ncbi:allantoate amidohydrolase [Puia sp.]|jgi:allantoate deiminase|uniref:allantoate amidohydrolase n=1 Tax=Puia sp. TaxID=2045100 RepID=UPI002F3FB7FC
MIHRANHIISRINQLAAISEDEKGITRRYGTPAALEAGRRLRQWMQNAGLHTRVDAIGNIRGRWPSATPNAKTFVIASHLDTVVNAGRWDGPLGVLAGLDILEHFIRENRTFPFHLELIAFCDEEGARFHTTYLGSKTLAGSLDPATLQRRDDQGMTLAAAITAIGGDPTRLAAEALPPEQWLGYFELHIEQGPILWEKKIPVAPVTAIAGQVRAELRFTGEAGHAGTVPPSMRHDALCAAAEFILTVENFARNSAADAGPPVLATVGKLSIPNAASNVIPGETTLSLDIRSADEASLESAHKHLRAAATTIAEHRSLTLHWNPIQSAAPVTCDPSLTTLLATAIRAAGIESLPLVSGAGHDAVPISALAPVSMLFVRCYKGISHNPAEHVEAEDLAAALAVAEKFICNLEEIVNHGDLRTNPIRR